MNETLNICSDNQNVIPVTGSRTITAVESPHSRSHRPL